MGCYLSKHGAHDSSGRLFRVIIVNDLGAELNAGKIEVSQNDLILYLKGREPVRWPLRCLRRYGFDEELFSFESGRRCPTGSGIYAFKCRRAEELFNLVQESIQNVGQSNQLRPSHLTVSSTGRQSSRPNSLVEPREPNGTFMSGNARVAFVPSDQRVYINGSAVSDNSPGSPNYVNTGEARDNVGRSSGPIDPASALIDFLHEPPNIQAPPPPQEPVNYADLELPRSTEDIFDQVQGAVGSGDGPGTTPNMADQDQDEGLPMMDNDDAVNFNDIDVFTDNPGEVSQQPNYINIGANGEIKERNVVIVQRSDSVTHEMSDAGRLSVQRQRSMDQNYANLGGSFNGNFNPVVMNPSPITPPSVVCTSDPPGELNYIEIDVNNKATNDTDSASGMTSSITSITYPTPDSPSKRTESYAMIDFRRTEALANPISDDGEGVRKTRHNSTIS